MSAIPESEFAAALQQRIEKARRDELPTLIGTLETARAKAWARLAPALSPSTAAPPAVAADLSAPGLLTADQAAALLGVTPRWLRQSTKGLKFRYDLSREQVRYDKIALLRWFQSRP